MLRPGSPVGDGGPHGLLASTSELERLVDLSVDMLCVATMGGRFIVVNPAWSVTLGWSESELCGTRAIDFVHPEDRERMLAEAARLAEPGVEVQDFEARFKHRDGSSRWLVWSARSDGTRLYAVARDVTHRKLAEASAREAHELFRTAFEHAPIGMALWSLDRAREFRPTEVNRAMARIIGHPAEALVDIPPRELVHADDFDQDRDQVLALLRGEASSCSFEKRFVRGDGNVIWGQVRLSLARDASGVARYGICQFIDVTDRHEAHEAVRASEQRLRKLVETAHEGVWLLDAEDRTSFVNWRLAEMLGYSVEEMQGRPVYDFLAEHGRSVMAARLAARREGVSDSQELRYIRKDGGEVWAIASGSPLTEEDGSYSGTLEMLVDITDRKRREQALRASEERYRNIIETTSEGVWMIDADHRTTYVNRRMAEMLGYTVKEMLGRPIADFAAHAERAGVERAIERRREGISDQREVCYIRKDGSEMWALLSGSPLSDGNGGYGGALAMLSDITERKQAECELARLAAAVESSPDAIFSMDLDGTIATWNGASERLYGYSKEEAIGSSVWMLAPEDKMEESRAIVSRLKRGEAEVAYRTTAVHRDGTVIEVEPSVTAIVAADGTLVGSLAIVRAPRD